MRPAAPWSLALVVALLAACSGEAPATAGAAAKLRAPIGGSPMLGPADAWVTIVEFSDFQCPYCKAESPVLEQARATYPDDVRLVYKHFPLSQHARARPAAYAAECAGEQGRFWDMARLLFQDLSLDDASLQGDADSLGLDLAAWQACLGRADIAARVDADRVLGDSLGVNGTPTLAVNGTRIDGALAWDDLKVEIASALAAAKASGVPRADYYDRVVMAP